MKINETGLNLIKKFEGLRLDAYPDPGTGDEPYTIGYGHTGPDVYLGKQVTEEQANDLLSQDVAKFERGVSQFTAVDLTENQFSALVVFSYNVGLHNLRTSTLLKKVNAKDFDGASKEFLKWDRAAGVVLPGLVTRRQAEKDLFLS